MNDLLQDFIDYLTGLSLVTTGFVWKNTIPNDPDESVAVYEYTGQNPILQIDGSNRSIQIVVRSASDATARQRISALYKSLLTEDGQIHLTPTRWGLLSMRQSPFKLKVDERQLIYYCFNLSIITYID